MDTAVKNPFPVVAILGAGVMGAQIAAHFVNAGIQVKLYDLASDGKDRDALPKNAIAALKKSKPAPLGLASWAKRIAPRNYDDHLEELQSCSLIIEAISERMDWKLALYEKITPHLSDNAILATNTSGLSISALSEALPESVRSRFLGVHFFNPPRYMKLVEVIPTEQTRSEVCDSMEDFLVAHFGKGVVFAKDTPNFVGNRIGVFSLLTILHYMETFNLSADRVDALTGPAIGRPKSASLRTLDVVGLDTFGHVVKTMETGLPDDPWAAYFKLPGFISDLIARGALGQKTRAGVYKKEQTKINVYDPDEKSYRPVSNKLDPELEAILAHRDWGEKLKALQASSKPEAQFLWATFRELFIYSAYHLSSIANNVRDVDSAIRWGFAWKQGPFETWQSAGWSEIVEMVDADIQAGKSLTQVSLPDWVKKQAGAYEGENAYSPVENQFIPPRERAVYQRSTPWSENAKMVFEDDFVAVSADDDGIGQLSLKTKMNTLSQGALKSIKTAVSAAETHLKGLVFLNPGPNFSVGADLKEFIELKENAGLEDIERASELFQETALALRDCNIPVVAAIRGFVFGGGCELAMHCDAVVAAFETYMGLVEVGVGIIPAGAGTKEFARRAALENDPFKALQTRFMTIAQAQVASSAYEAIEKGYLRDSDTIVFNADEIGFVAKARATAMAEQPYRPTPISKFPVGGTALKSTLEMALVNMLEGHFISEHDYAIGQALAEVISGGALPEGTLVEEAYLLALERKAFAQLASTEKSIARVRHMLEHGKPLRN